MLVRYQAQMIRDDRIVQEFPATNFTCPEQAEERAMYCIKNITHRRTVLNFEEKDRLIIDFFRSDAQDDVYFLRRIFSGSREDLFSILRAVLVCQQQVRKENLKPPL